MKATLLDDKLTPLTAPEVCRAFHSAYSQVFASPPSTRTLAILMAQSALESGRWKSLHRANFTNIKASETYEGYYVLYRCNEIINGKVEWFDPPHYQCRFRAFLSVQEGAVDYLRFLTRARYLQALTEAQRGDPRSFVAALKRGGFFTAAEEPYAKAVVSLTAEYERQIPGWLAEEPAESKPPIAPPLTDEDRARIEALRIEHMHSLLEQNQQDGHRDMLEDDDKTPTDRAPPPSDPEPNS